MEKLIKVLVVSDDDETTKELKFGLANSGIAFSVASDAERAMEIAKNEKNDLVLVDMDNSKTSEVKDLPRSLKMKRHIPVIVLISMETLEDLDSNLSIDDFVLKPCNLSEVIMRVKRVLRQKSDIDSGELIRCGDLVIDLAKCEVTVDGALLMLTYKEYELLKFLANNKGRVFTREALLNKVWGYDYYGGERTVDVHIRRLRSKIEGNGHLFIETVRNIGYRFNPDI